MKYETEKNLVFADQCCFLFSLVDSSIIYGQSSKNTYDLKNEMT
jgi:hypothetical protein